MKENNKFKFKVGFSNNKFETDFPYGDDKISIKFKYYNDKITICEITDPQANQIYTQFASMNVFSKKIFKPEIYKDAIIFMGKAICLEEDKYDKQKGEIIAIVKALSKRQAFYIMLMDLMKIRLWNIQMETNKTIMNKWHSIWNKRIEQDIKENTDKQLELPFKEIELNIGRSQSTI